MDGNLSNQFDLATDVEKEQRRRFKRKREYGFVGNGYHFANYPYMIGALSAGSLISTPERQQQLDEYNDNTVSPSTGMGDGGTAASATGAAGGSPA